MPGLPAKMAALFVVCYQLGVFLGVGWGEPHSTEPANPIIQTQLLSLQKCEPSGKQFILFFLSFPSWSAADSSAVGNEASSSCVLGFFQGGPEAKKKSNAQHVYVHNFPLVSPHNHRAILV